MAEATLKDKTAKGILWGAMNNGGMQLLNAVFGIVLGRVLNQEEYGLVGMLLIFTYIANSLQDSGLCTALTNKPEARHEEYNSVFWFQTAVSFVIVTLLCLMSPLIADFYHEERLIWLSRYLFVTIFIAALGNVPRNLLFRELRQKDIAIITLTALVLSGIVGISMALLGMSYWSIVTQTLVYISTMTIMSWKRSGWMPTLSFSFEHIKQNFGFSSRVLATNIFNHLNNNIFAILLGRLYRASDVGSYTQASKWEVMGFSTINGVVQGVAQPTFVQVGKDKTRLCHAFGKMLRFTCFVSFPLMLGLAMVAPEFITLLIGDKWLSSAEYMRILCIAGAFLPIATLYNNMLISQGQSRIYMWNIIAQGVLNLSGILLVHHLGGSIRDMICVYTGLVVAWTAVWHTFVQRAIGFRALQAVREIAPFLFIATATMLVTYLATSWIEARPLLLLSRIALAAAIYIGILWITGAKILRESLSYLLHRK